MTLAVNPTEVVAAHSVAAVKLEQHWEEACVVTCKVVVHPQLVVHLCLCPQVLAFTSHLLMEQVVIVVLVVVVNLVKSTFCAIYT